MLKSGISTSERKHPHGFCETGRGALFSAEIQRPPVEAGEALRRLEAGRNAPTAHNLQPQRIFVLQSSEALEKVDGCTGAHFHPPVMLLVAYDPEAAWKRRTTARTTARSMRPSPSPR